MTKRTRTGLFLLSVLAFLVFAPSLVLYSQGYRLDLRNKKLTKTGGLYLKVLPKNSEIYLDGQFKKKGDFLFGSALIDNLLPRDYLVEVKKEGYVPWQKRLMVNPAGVTEAKNVILFPGKISLQDSFQTLTTAVNGSQFWVSPSERKIVLEKADNQGWYLTLFDLPSRVEEILLKERSLAKKGGVSLLGLSWSADSQKIVLQTALNEQEKHFLLDLQQKPFAMTSLDYLGTVDKLDFAKSDANKFFLLQDGQLSAGDFTAKTTQPLAENVLAFAPGSNQVFFLNQDGFLNSSDGTTIQKISQQPLAVKPETSYELTSAGSRVFLKEGEKLWWLNSEKNFAEIASAVQDFALSPDKTKLCFLNSSEIWVLFLEDLLGQPARKAGGKIMLTRFSERIKNAFWLTDDYLVFQTGDAIKATEIDDRDQLNLTDLAQTPDSVFFLSRLNKKTQLLILGASQLKISGELLP